MKGYEALQATENNLCTRKMLQHQNNRNINRILRSLQSMCWCIVQAAGVSIILVAIGNRIN